MWAVAACALAAAACLLIVWLPRRTTPPGPLPEAKEGRDQRGPLAGRALSPTIGAVFSPEREKLEQLSARVALRKDPKMGDIVHALHVFGGEVRAPAGPGGQVRAVELMLDSGKGNEVFGVPTLYPTRYGARFFLHDPVRLGTNQGSSEGHPGQALSILAELGVPLTQPIVLPGGKQGTLQMVLDDLVANFVLEGEIYWDAAALALYVPPARSWRNKFGKEFTFDALAEELLGRPLSDSACCGTHRLITLTVLLRVDAEERILSPAVADRIRRHLKEVAEALAAHQRPDGTWQAGWPDYLPGAKPGNWGRPDVESMVITTGHHLEWLLLLPEGMRPPRQVYAKAAEWLLNAVLRQAANEAWLREWYCPASHAVRVVRLLARPAEATAAQGHKGRPPS
jgi:hypothetical protein